MCICFILTLMFLSEILSFQIPSVKPSFPFVGSFDMIIASVTGKFIPKLLEEKSRLGSLFQFQTGPINQIWICDKDQGIRLLQTESCSGRSQLSEPVFGGDFLFLKTN